MHYKSRVNNVKLKEIYSEFWEYVDDENKTFKEFIENDSRRLK